MSAKRTGSVLRAAADGSRRARAASPPRTLVILGLSAEGLALARRAAARGFSVTGFEIDEVKLIQLRKNGERGITFSSDVSVLATCDIACICMDSPLISRRSKDPSPLQICTEFSTAHLAAGALVVLETPTGIGGCDEVILPALGSIERAEPNLFAYCPCADPEAIDGFRVLAARGAEALERASILYAALLEEPPKIAASFKEAEAAYLCVRAGLAAETALHEEFRGLFSTTEIDPLAALSDTQPRSAAAVASAAAACEELLRYGFERRMALHLLRAARRVLSRPQEEQRRAEDL